MSNICVVGIGYVGLVTGTCFADLGNRVICLNTNREKAENLKKGILPIFEPGLEELVHRNYQAGRLFFTTEYEEAVAGADFVFIAVGTPSGQEGEADLSHVEAAAEGVARSMTGPTVIVNKSTVPIGAGDFVASVVRKSRRSDHEFAVVSNPEFLREGSGVYDFLNPDRVVLGATERWAAEKVAELYSPLKCPVIITDLRTAEMIKYASNAFLAARISFINEIASICERLGADVKQVALGMGYDKRIGHSFLDAGVGWGGSCFPKDVKALEYMAAMEGCHPQLLRAVMEINRDQRRRLVQKVRDALGSLEDTTIGVLGLSFKPNTDDMREAPSTEVIHLLQHQGAAVKAYDPVAFKVAERYLSRVEFCADPYAVASGSDALVILTEWNEFKQLSMSRIKSLLRRPIVIDGRNIYDPVEMRNLGFVYQGMGRGMWDGVPAASIP
ncbi:MAG: UDP-glucose/GDP-mannose dehydrogenase family protein [Chloroflexi bacterium]|nr:UDP-glucose/GDP-mannose dehydrogenase family protein [Chloroflexota bacterium]